MFDQAGVGIAAGTTNDSVRGDEFQSSNSLVLALVLQARARILESEQLSAIVAVTRGVMT